MMEVHLATHYVRSLRQAASALKAVRKAHGLTQGQPAARTGRAQSTISDIENGVTSVSLDVYLRLLEALDAELVVAPRGGPPGQNIKVNGS